MNYLKHFLFFLAFVLVASCACRPPQSYDNDHPYAIEVMKNASEWLSQLESDIPDEPVCRLGIIFESNLIISGLSPSALDAGFLLGDCLSAIDNEVILSEEGLMQNISKNRAGDLVKIVVVRGGESIEIEAKCKDGREIRQLDIELVKAASRGDWDKCISLSGKAEKENGKISEYSYIRLCCNEAKRLASGQEPTEKDAELHHEHFTRMISEARYDQEALGSIQGELSTGISWLEHYGFDKLAKDLMAQWEAAVNLEMPNCMPSEDKRMILYVPK